MMFVRLSSTVYALALGASLANAVPTLGGSSCNTGSLNCCESVESTNDPAIQTLAGALNVALPSVAALVGLHCNPISALGLGSNSCSAQPVCCTGNQMAGVITLGCDPINASL